MCEALERIYLEVNGERLARERQEYIDKAVAEGIAQGIAEAVDAAVAEAVDAAVAEAVKEAVEKTRAEQAAYIKELETKLAMYNV